MQLFLPKAESLPQGNNVQHAEPNEAAAAELHATGDEGISLGISTASASHSQFSDADRAHETATGLDHRKGQGQRVIMHCDVDCFYCQVERLDDASLKGVPLAVQQFNSGGFVAVSYEVSAH